MIQVTDDGPIRTLRLNRPPVNALGSELLTRLCDELAEAHREGSRAVVLAGRSGMFSAGLDVLELAAARDRETLEPALRRLFDVMAALAGSPIPVVAAIDGHSPAGGLVLSMLCDWRVMVDGPFTIGLNEVRIGIPMPGAIAALASRVVGPRRSETMCTTGAMFSPHEALRIGLVDELAPPGEVEVRAHEWCRHCLELPPRAFADSRAIARADLVELVRKWREEDTASLLEAWFRDEVQGCLKELIGRLRRDG